MDEAALEQHIPALRRYAFALVRDHAAADDLVQDCLERALGRLYLRRKDGDLRAWLFTILRNLHLGALRRKRTTPGAVPLDMVPEPPVRATQEQSLEVRDILLALDTLEEEQKSVLLLVGVEDLSYAETAAVLGIPLGTVMSRLSRARGRLRKAMELGRPNWLRRVK